MKSSQKPFFPFFYYSGNNLSFYFIQKNIFAQTGLKRTPDLLSKCTVEGIDSGVRGFCSLLLHPWASLKIELKSLRIPARAKEYL